MITCSNCKQEYDDTEKNCPNCGRAKDDRETKPDGKWVLLTTVKNDIEFEMIKDILEMGNIPAVRNVKGVDGFVQIILGVPIAGIDVLVPEDRLEEAVQILEARTEEDFENEME